MVFLFCRGHLLAGHWYPLRFIQELLFGEYR